jgi:hypothetical protein
MRPAICMASAIGLHQIGEAIEHPGALKAAHPRTWAIFEHGGRRLDGKTDVRGNAFSVMRDEPAACRRLPLDDAGAGTCDPTAADELLVASLAHAFPLHCHTAWAMIASSVAP